MTSFAPGTNSDYANAYNNWWFNNNGQGPAPQRSAFGADSPVGKAQSIQPQSQGTPYGQPKKSTPFSAYSPQQQGGAFSAYQTPSSFSAGGGMGNYAYSQPNARPQPFVQQTFDFTGRQADPTQLFAQRDAFVQSINNARAPFAMAVGQGTATAPQQLDFQQLWGQAGDMAQGGFSNPFAQQQYSQPRPSQADAIRNLFTQNNIQAPQGFMDQLLGMLGQQAPQPQLQQPMRQPQLPWMDEMPYGGTPRQPAMPSPWRNPAEDFVDTGAGFQVLQRYRNPQTGETFTAPNSGVQPRPGTGWEPAYGGSQPPRQSPSADQLLNPAYQEWRSQQIVTQVARSPAQRAELEKGMYERFLRETGRAPSRPGAAQPIQPPSTGTPYQPSAQAKSTADRLAKEKAVADWQLRREREEATKQAQKMFGHSSPSEATVKLVMDMRTGKQPMYQGAETGQQDYMRKELLYGTYADNRYARGDDRLAGDKRVAAEQARIWAMTPQEVEREFKRRGLVPTKLPANVAKAKVDRNYVPEPEYPGIGPPKDSVKKKKKK